MLCFPNAKINLGLNVVSKRQDGYHNLETVFYPIGLKDALEIVPFEGKSPYRFSLSGIAIDGAVDDNLVVKAYKLIAKEKEIRPIDIYLLKQIPFGAGLGGGSADAAFMLKLLNDAFSLGYCEGELEVFAAKLGADCPFFVRNQPAFATGVGDVLEPIELDLSRYRFVLVKPPFGVPTKDAYALLSPREPEISLKEIVRKPLAEWRDCMKNDFETPVFKKYPQIQRIKDELYRRGAVYASMSGSGSAVYAFFDDAPGLDKGFEGCFVWKEGSRRVCQK
ncbi:MAG: 4-(cytidine 5'-diphospho)-2-C-methyl-D-erythritol kinase [Dysgonamonadaceae bacterium]|jgi:4-diphosphocytidyl-2-C-methyl-D-erythritol kinase|nr:4-(cytidine 5'-diphospho)-2-C-methyl-D-erythritol kinase [Dysgonamonadaceae bacterium]